MFLAFQFFPSRHASPVTRHSLSNNVLNFRFMDKYVFIPGLFQPVNQAVSDLFCCGVIEPGSSEKLSTYSVVKSVNNLCQSMKNLLRTVFALVLGAAGLVPTPASAYYYHGRYYRYYNRGHYYRYHYRGHYYRHRRWVVVTGRPAYYRYW